MKNNKIIFIIIVFLLIIFSGIFFLKTCKNYDSIIYNGKTYIYLESSEDIFYYYFNNNSNNYYEVDEIYPVMHNKWDFICLNGDLFIYEKDLKDAKKYYLNDKNYFWSVVIDKEENEEEFLISLSAAEIDFLYSLKNVTKEEKIPFSHIENFGSIVKTSDDKMIKGVLSIAYYNNNWYWKTETMDEYDDDLEFVVKLPGSLNKKIEDFLID